MLPVNLLRAVTFLGGAGVLIFSQNHSLTLGVNVVLYLATATSIAGFAMLMIPGIRVTPLSLILPSGGAFVVMLYGISSWWGSIGADARTLQTLNILIALFIGTIAVTELVQSFTELDEDTLELKISAAIGILSALIFVFVPMDIINSLGILSAYLAISAVQRAVWIATAGKKVSQ